MPVEEMPKAPAVSTISMPGKITKISQKNMLKVLRVLKHAETPTMCGHFNHVFKIRHI